MSSCGFLFFCRRQMPVIVPLLTPGRAGWVFATILAPLDVRALAEHVGLHERSDVQAHAVVQVGMPADGLLLQRLPTDKNVVWPHMCPYRVFRPVLSQSPALLDERTPSCLHVSTSAQFQLSTRSAVTLDRHHSRYRRPYEPLLIRGGDKGDRLERRGRPERF